MAHLLSALWQLFVFGLVLMGLALRLYQLWTLVAGALRWLWCLVEDVTGPRYTIPYTRPTRRALEPSVARSRAPARRERRRFRLAGSPTLRPREGAARCAYCHDDLAVGRADHTCPGCATRLHPECWSELLACPTPGCGRRAA